MKQHIFRLFAILALCGLITPLTAQIVSNVDFYQKGDMVHITYSLYKKSHIELQVSMDGGKKYSQRLKNVSGDVGSYISPGTKKEIVWDALKEFDAVKGDNIVFRIKATPVSENNYSHNQYSSNNNSYRNTSYRNTSKYSDIGFTKYKFQFQAAAGLILDPSGDLGYRINLGLGIRFKNFFYLGAFVNMDNAITVVDNNIYFEPIAAKEQFNCPIGVQMIGYLPCGTTMVSNKVYPYLSANLGYSLLNDGYNSRFYYDITVGLDMWIIKAGIGYGTCGLIVDVGFVL